MKVFVLIAVVALLSGANAGSFTDFLHKIGDEIKNTLSSVGNTMKPLATNLLSSLLDTAKTQGSKLLGGLVSSLTNVLSTAPSSKRDIASIMSFVEKGKSVIDNVAHTLGAIFHGAMTKLESLTQKIHSLEFLKEPVENILSEISSVVNLHGHLQLANLGEILKIGEHFVHSMLHKRSGFLDSISSFTHSITSLFKPITDLVTKHVTNLGSSLAAAASGIAQSFTPHLNALKSQLHEHLNTFHTIGKSLLKNGLDAFTALKSAAVDILGQTFKNAAPAVQQLLETGKSAAGVIKDHLAQTLSG